MFRYLFTFALIILFLRPAISQHINHQLFEAVRDNKPVQTEVLIKQGADVNAQTSDGLSPLIFAAYNNNVLGCRLLIKAGADINQTDNENKTAADYAKEQDHDALVKYLENPEKYEDISPLLNFHQSNLIASDYYDANELKKAIKYYVISRSKAEREYGKRSSEYIESCSKLADTYFYADNYQKALPLYIEENNLLKATLGASHPDYATSCFGLAKLYRDMGDNDKALPLFRETKQIREKAFGKGSFEYNISCISLAPAYAAVKDYENAEQVYSEIQEIYKEKYGEEHSLYLRVCNDFASMYFESRQYQKAEALYKEIIENTAKLHGDESLEYALVCDKLGKTYLKKENYPQALHYFEQTNTIIETLLGKKNEHYARVCASLASLYDDTGEYGKAEQLYLEAINIDSEIIGKEHLDYAEKCNALAQLYFKVGNYDKAQTLMHKAKTVFEQSPDADAVDYAKICNNLGMIYKNQAKYEDALKLYLEALKILDKNDPNYATSCNNLANIFMLLDDYNEAEAYFLKARQIIEKNYGKNHSKYALACNNLAVLYASSHNLDKAEKLYLEAQAIYKSIFGKKHRTYSIVTKNLAQLYQSMGKYSKALKLYLGVNGIVNAFLNESSKFMSEKERSYFLTNEIDNYFDILHSFYLTSKRTNSKQAGTVYNNALHLKGQLLRSSTAVRKAVLQSKDSTLINKYEKMNAIGQMLNKEYSKPLKERRPDIADLKEQMNGLEKDLVRASHTIAKVSNADKTDWKIIQKSLEKNEFALEFVRFRYHNDTKQTDSILYYALILNEKSKFPKAVYLCEEKQLQQLLERPSGKSEYEYIKQLYDPESAKADSLYAMLWKPIEKYLPKTKKTKLPKIYISPTGLLNAISFDALPGESGLLSDKYTMVYVSTTAEIAHYTKLNSSDIDKAVLFGGIDYDAGYSELMQNSNNSTSNQPTDTEYFSSEKLTRSGVSWSYLPGSLTEGEQISKIIAEKGQSVQFCKGKNSSEELFKSLTKQNPSVLHISTHGFYFGDDQKSLHYKSMIDENVSFAHSENPLLRSGFILAGGNNAFRGKPAPEDVEDGVLTAYEISKLNFFGTKLAVLSACQTGLGDVKGNEGVYGLQRAFKMAGAQYLIYSLWEVPDKATQELMTSLYENWFSGMEIRVAFKEAQNRLKEKYKEVPGSAFAWAAFVLMK